MSDKSARDPGAKPRRPTTAPADPSATMELMEAEPGERRALVRVARIATGRASPESSAERPRAADFAARWAQAAHAVTLWTYAAPFLWLSPFHANPPLWLAALSRLPTHEPHPPSD